MNVDEAQVTALVREVKELLSAASVGLYEFIWVLRSAAPGAPSEQLRQVSYEALRSLVEEGDVRLILLKWPEEHAIGEVSFENLTEKAWNDPVDGVEYVAVARV